MTTEFPFKRFMILEDFVLMKLDLHTIELNTENTSKIHTKYFQNGPKATSKQNRNRPKMYLKRPHKKANVAF